MTKNDLINDVAYVLSKDLSNEQVEFVKIVLFAKMKDLEIKESNYLPAVDTIDNDWILKRFIIDMTAAGKAESTIKQYVKCVRRFLDYVKKDYREVNGQDIIDWLAVKQYMGEIGQNGKVTLKNYLSSFFRWAYRKHHILTDIMLEVDTMSPVQKRKDRISDIEIEKMRNSCITKREKALFELLISCGIRVGEIKYIRKQDIDFDKKTVSVYGEKTKQTRICNLTIRAIIALKEYLLNEEADMPIFNWRGNALSNRTLERIAKGIGERAGVHLKTTVHVYRKTFASVLYRKTKDIVMVSTLLGHSSVAITVRYYLCDDMEDMNYRYGVIMN